MTVRDQWGDPLDPADVLDADEMAVYRAEKGDLRYQWALTAGRCGECGAAIKLTDLHCWGHGPTLAELVGDVAEAQRRAAS